MESDPRGPHAVLKDPAKTLVNQVKQLSNTLLHPVGVNMNVYGGQVTTLFVSTARKLLRVAGEEWLSPWYIFSAQAFAETSPKNNAPFSFAAYGSINFDEIPLAPDIRHMKCSKEYCRGSCSRPTFCRINDTQVTRFKETNQNRPAPRRIDKEGDRIGRLERKSKPNVIKPMPRLQLVSYRDIRPPPPAAPVSSSNAFFNSDESSGTTPGPLNSSNEAKLKRPREDNNNIQINSIQQSPSKKICLSAPKFPTNLPSKAHTKLKGKKRSWDNYDKDRGGSSSDSPPNKKARISTPVGSHAQWHIKMSNFASPIPQTESRRRLKRRNRLYIAPRLVPYLEPPLEVANSASSEHQTWNPIPETMIGARSYNRVIRSYPNSRTVHVLEYLCNLPPTSSPRSTGPSCLVCVDTV